MTNQKIEILRRHNPNISELWLKANDYIFVAMDEYSQLSNKALLDACEEAIILLKNKAGNETQAGALDVTDLAILATLKSAINKAKELE